MKRRKFVEYGAAAGLGLAMTPKMVNYLTPKAQSTDQPLIKKSLKFGMIKEDLSILDKFKLVKSLGFDGVEMDSPNDLDRQEIIDAMEESGIEIPGVVNSVHWKAPLSDPDPAIRKKCLESVKVAIDDCKAFGGTTVLLVPAVVKAEVAYEDAYKRSQEEIRKILPYAKEAGINIAIENVWNNFLLSPVEAARYIDQFDSPVIGWYFDVGNIVRYGWPEHWIKTLGKRIMKIDIKEYSRKIQSDEGVWKGFKVEIGEGDCNWAAVNKALKEVGYQGWGSAEVPGGDRQRLKEISERMDMIYKR